MIRTTYGDHERCRINYFSHYKGYYFTGDGAKRDENGMYRIIGRIDDVINVSGHRFGTAEIENAINTNSHVIESAVVGYPHDIKGQGIYAYVTLMNGIQPSEDLRKALGIARWDVYGISYGTMQADWLMDVNPASVRRIATTSSAAFSQST